MTKEPTNATCSFNVCYPLELQASLLCAVLRCSGLMAVLGSKQ